MEVFFVYLWLKLDAVLLTLLICGLILIASPINYAFRRDTTFREEEINHIKSQWPSYKRAFKTGLFILLLFVMLPSSKQTAILVGTSYAVDLAKSPEGGKVASLIRKKANDYLDEALKEAEKDGTK